MRLYHYVHCPFCLRVRMTLGFLNISYESTVVRYDDEETPIKLTGIKMLPIFEFNDQSVINESLEIVKRLDKGNLLNIASYELKKENIETLLKNIAENVHSLCMPYWIWTPEFDEKSRVYFQQKKEIKRGPFKNLIQKKGKYIENLNEILLELEPELEPYYQSKKLTIIDIMIASHLWGLYIFPEFQFSKNINQYLQNVKNECRFDYHQDFWK